jgi:hypothetical protein
LCVFVRLIQISDLAEEQHTSHVHHSKPNNKQSKQPRNKQRGEFYVIFAIVKTVSAMPVVLERARKMSGSSGE